MSVEKLDPLEQEFLDTMSQEFRQYFSEEQAVMCATIAKDFAKKVLC